MSKWIYIIISLFVFVLAFYICITNGSTGFMPDIIFDLSDNAIRNIRIPRVILVAVVGAILSICGASMQSMLQNPLAEGSTVGVSSGASLGAVVAIIVSSHLSIFNNLLNGVSTTVGAILFAFMSLCLILAIGYRIDKHISTNTIILLGVIFSMFTSAIVSLLIYLFPENTQTITFWTMGSCVGANYFKCAILFVAGFLGGFILICVSTHLDICSLGDNKAQNLGVNVRLCRLIVMIIVSVLIGLCVSVCGVISFVGLIVPHIVRFIFGPQNKTLMIFSIFFGSTFLMISDLVSRVLIAPKELPIGIVTSIVGSVVFIIVYYNYYMRKK